MQCPVCKDTQLAMTTRQDIEIDYCPQCRGVWLDRGELDKIIERSGQQQPQYAAPPQAVPVDPYGRDSRGHGRGHHGNGQGSFLKRLFD